MGMGVEGEGARSRMRRRWRGGFRTLCDGFERTEMVRSKLAEPASVVTDDFVFQSGEWDDPRSLWSKRGRWQLLPCRSAFLTNWCCRSDEERPSAQDNERTPRVENGRLFSATANPAFAGTRPARVGASSQPGLRSPLEPSSLATPSPLDDDQSLRLHGRNASHSTMQSLEPEKRPGLKSKKSLPDLRLSHADILAERRTGTTIEEEERATMPSMASALRRLKEDRRPAMVHANSARAALPTQLALANSAPASSAPSSPSAAPRSQSARAVPTTLSRSTGVRPTPPPSSATRADFESQNKLKRGEVDSSANGLDRNSGAYFRRLSMLPASTISKAVPVTLLEFADAIRGILFSLSQVYTALRQFVVFASQDRLPAPLARLMGSADGSMSLLINALDRFDSLSRRGTPNPTIVRDIFVTCRDNVVTFGKLVTALGPQLKALVATADVRYTRTLLLMLYGSMGEIANSWNAVSPLLEEMTVLNEDPSLATLILQPPTPSPTSLSSSTSSRPGPAGVGSLYRARSKTRRHAGSFSVEDVQLGSAIPPAPFPPPTPTLPAYAADLSTGALSNGSASTTSLPNDQWTEGTIKVRPGKSSRTPIPPSIPLPSHPGYRDLVLNAFDHPMTPSGTALMLSEPLGDPMSASTYGGFNLGSTLPMPPNSAPSRTDTFAVPRSEGLRNGSTANADELFLNLVEATTSIAFDVYGMLLNSFDEDADGDDDEGAGVLMRDLGPRRTKELTDMCILGNETATKLRGALGRVRGLEGMHGTLAFSPADAKRLGDESYTFVQVSLALLSRIRWFLTFLFPRADRHSLCQARQSYLGRTWLRSSHSGGRRPAHHRYARGQLLFPRRSRSPADSFLFLAVRKAPFAYGHFLPPSSTRRRCPPSFVVPHLTLYTIYSRVVPSCTFLPPLSTLTPIVYFSAKD